MLKLTINDDDAIDTTTIIHIIIHRRCTCAHARSHARAHTHTHTHTYVHTRAHVHTCCYWVPSSFIILQVLFKHLSPDLAVFPWCNAAVGGAKSIIAKHVARHITKHSPDSRKENMLSLLTGQGNGYCCILLLQVRPEGKVLSSQIAFGAHTTRIANVSVAWRHSW